MTNEELTESQSRDAKRESGGSRAQRWDAFIMELRGYIEEHHLGPSKHTTLYNQCRYFKRKLKDGTFEGEKAKVLECVLGQRDLSLHTGGRRKKKSEI